MYENVATVRLQSEPASSAPLEHFVCTQGNSGGGLYVANGGVANLDACNMFSNEADVRPPYAPSLSLLQRPAGTFRVLAFLSQDGAGLYVLGVANLNGCQVYDNQASVRAPAPGLTSSAPLERFICSLSACSLALGSTSDMVARPTSMDARCTRIRLRCVLPSRALPPAPR